MATRKQGLQLSELIEEMRNIIHNNGRFCFSDFTCDIQLIAALQEKRGGFSRYWAVRENGTIITDNAGEIAEWRQICVCLGAYKITYKNGFYSFKSI